MNKKDLIEEAKKEFDGIDFKAPSYEKSIALKDMVEEIEKRIIYYIEKAWENGKIELFNHLWATSAGKTTNDEKVALLLFRELNKVRKALTQKEKEKK